MKNEIIKNIIYRLDCKSPTAYDEIELSKEESNLLLDYITNLQNGFKSTVEELCETTEKFEKLQKENKDLKKQLNTIEKYIRTWKIEDINEKTMLILNDILLIKNGMEETIKRLTGGDDNE